MLLKWLVVLPLSLAAICPLQRHQVCNVRNAELRHLIDSQHQCTCAITQVSDLPAPEQSCSNLIKRGENGTFPVISITFNLNESPGIEEFPENSFRNTIASALRVSPADILLLRINCQGTDDFLTVQFAVLKKVYDDNDDSIKYDVSMFVDAESVAARMKAMGHLSQIAGLQVDSIEF
ncbi:hypothetical protein Angca_006981, partial [Angiostrongylus cantonensis]